MTRDDAHEILRALAGALAPNDAGTARGGANLHNVPRGDRAKASRARGQIARRDFGKWDATKTGLTHIDVLLKC